MITADTITDEQIRELHSQIENFNANDAIEIMRAWHALGVNGRQPPRWYRRRRKARERCAEILNERERKA